MGCLVGFRSESIFSCGEDRWPAVDEWVERVLVPCSCDIVPPSCFRLVVDGQRSIASFVLQSERGVVLCSCVGCSWCFRVRQDRIFPVWEGKSSRSVVGSRRLSREHVDPALRAWLEGQWLLVFLIDCEAVEEDCPVFGIGSIGDFESGEVGSWLAKDFQILVRISFKG